MPETKDKPGPEGKPDTGLNTLQSVVEGDNVDQTVNTNSSAKDYGYTIGWDGKDYSKDKSFKKLQEGECLPSFKMWGDTNKVYKGCSYVDTTKIKFPDKLSNEMGKICATSISTTGPRKGSLKTYGICKKPEGVEVEVPLNTNRGAAKENNLKSVKSESEGESVNKQGANQNKGVVIDHDGDVVPDVYGDATDLTGQAIDLTQTKNKQIKPGKCIFPFKYRTSKLSL